MKMLDRFYVLCFCIIFCCMACHTTNKQHEEEIDSVDVKKENLYAEGFEIYATSNGYRVLSKNPWKGNNQTYTYNLKRENNATNEMFIQIPAKRIICLSAPHIAYIDELGFSDYIVAVSGKQFIYNEKILADIHTGKIKDIGIEGNYDYEAIIALQPDVVFAFGVDQHSLQYLEKLKQLRIPVVLLGEYMETQPLGRAEWLKFFACFFDSLNQAEEKFRQIEQRYLAIKNKPKSFSPLVLNGLPYSGNWYVPGARSFMANLMRDAGADHSWVDNEEVSGVPVSPEKIYILADSFQVWLNTDLANTLEEVVRAEPRAKHFNPVKSKQVYNCTNRTNANGGNDYWESGSVHPDLILNDLYLIFQQQPGDLYFYKKIE